MYLNQSEKFKKMVLEVKKILGLPPNWQSEATELYACRNLWDFVLMDNLNNPSPVIDANGSDEEKRLYQLLEKCYYLELYQRMNQTVVNKIQDSSHSASWRGLWAGFRGKQARRRLSSPSNTRSCQRTTPPSTPS